MTPPVEVEVGQHWQHRGESWRWLEIVHVVPEVLPNERYVGDPGVRAYAEVTRNTSNRRQAIALSTLRAKYRLRGRAAR